MSVDMRLDADGNPDLTDGTLQVKGLEELQQSLKLRLLSQPGWAKDDENFGVEWLGLFNDVSGQNIMEAKIADAILQDTRVAAVSDITITRTDREVQIQTKLELTNPENYTDEDNHNPDLDFNLAL